MLRRTSRGPALVVCNTCRFSNEQREDATGRRGGRLLSDQLRALLPSHVCSGFLRIDEMPCLFACSHHCTVHLRCEDKIGYVLGRLSPSTEDAQALLDYAARYMCTPEGIVPYEYWPERIRSHFIARTPPEGFIYDRDPPQS